MGVVSEALHNLLKRPFTRQYPAEREDAPERFRGNIRYESKKCIGCRLCSNNCPVQAIDFHKKGKIDFDMTACIYCGLCGDVCPTKAITDLSSNPQSARAVGDGLSTSTSFLATDTQCYQYIDLAAFILQPLINSQCCLRFCLCF